MTMDSAALAAVRLLAEHRLPGIVVTDGDATLHAVLPASDVVGFLVPRYVQEDPSLAAVLSESAADRIADRLHGKTVGELLPSKTKPMIAVARAERARPDCTDHLALAPGLFLDRGHEPAAQQDPVRRFLFEISDSSWCAAVTQQDLVDTARALVDSHPEVCQQTAGLPAADVIAFID